MLADLHKLFPEKIDIFQLIERRDVPAINDIDLQVHTILEAVGRDCGLEFVQQNREALQAVGLYEFFLETAFLGCRFNWHRYPLQDLKAMFRGASRDLLRAWGPLPGSGPFALFRGIAGEGEARRPRGLSWTADRDRAVWFAERLGLQAPAVVKAILPARSVFFYTTRRGEAEFVCDVPAITPLRIVWRGEPLPGVRELAAVLMARPPGGESL